MTFVLAVGRQINCDCGKIVYVFFFRNHSFISVFLDFSMPVDDGPETVGNAVNCENPNSNCNASGGGQIQVGYEPAGDGLFRDPQEVLGLFK